jgi:GNAT superfamily N-acetyltransferase
MEIASYESWMRSQVIELFAMEYGVSPEQFEELFVQFYEHPFQANKGIRIVAVEGQKVGGFQSFFYWPIESGGELRLTYQSGNSLVHPDFRGKGLFAKMLNYIHEPGKGFDFDFLIGFPVQASYNSFMRNQWNNPFDLQWFVRPVSPLRSFIGDENKRNERFYGSRVPQTLHLPQSHTGVAQHLEFDNYRFNYQKDPLYRVAVELNGDRALFELKSQRRKTLIREMVIGKAAFTSMDSKFVRYAFGELIRQVSKCGTSAILSIAVNPNVSVLVETIRHFQFRPINKKIFFITKGISPDVRDWDNWSFFRGDIDTW